MSDDQNVQRQLLDLSRAIEGVISSLPDGVEGTVSVRENHVYVEIQGPRLEVLGSEAPEIVYDSQYIRYELIPGGMEEQIDFAKETVDDIAEFLLSDRNPVECKSRFLGRPYLSVSLAGDVEWRLKKFNRCHHSDSFP
jgi:hypothetical protein